MSYICRHCNREFAKETSLQVHVCEHKKRYLEREETGVQIGLQAYLTFYEITQGSAKLKSWDDFVKSPYYKAFVKFGRYCQSIRAINIPRFIDWLLKNNKKIDYWCRDSVYTEYLENYLKVEAVSDALTRAIEYSITWSENTGSPSHDCLRFGNDNAICHNIISGRVSPWVLYNCDSGIEFLGRINQGQLAMIWTLVDTDYWSKKFQDYAADQEYVKDILKQAGW